MKQTLFFAFIFTLMSSVWALDDLGVGLSLDSALKIAFVKNPKMEEARKEVVASKGRWIQAEALPDTEMELNVGGLKENEKGARKGELDSFSIKQPLEPFGARFLNARMARDGVNIAKNGLAVDWGEVAAQVMETYANILAEEKSLAVSKDNLETTRQLLAKVETKFQSGNAAKSDLIRANIEVTRAKNDLLTSEKNLKVLKGEMNLLLGKGAEEPISLSDSLGYEPYTRKILRTIGGSLEGQS